MTKTCTACHIEKNIDFFRVGHAYTGGYATWCKACAKKVHKEWQKRNKEKSAHYKRKAYLKSEYGITLEKYNELFQKQKGCCAICNTHQQLLIKKLCVDHNHINGQVRGLLCFKCNTALGALNENPVLFTTAIAYLDSWRSR